MDTLSTALVCPEHPYSPTDRFRDGAVYCGSCGRPGYEFVRVNLAPVDKFF